MKFTYGSGERVLEGYTLKRGVGRGGFGEVFYAVSDAGRRGPPVPLPPAPLMIRRWPEHAPAARAARAV